MPCLVSGRLASSLNPFACCGRRWLVESSAAPQGGAINGASGSTGYFVEAGENLVESVGSVWLRLVAGLSAAGRAGSASRSSARGQGGMGPQGSVCGRRSISTEGN